MVLSVQRRTKLSKKSSSSSGDKLPHCYEPNHIDVDMQIRKSRKCERLLTKVQTRHDGSKCSAEH